MVFPLPRADQSALPFDGWLNFRIATSSSKSAKLSLNGGYFGLLEDGGLFASVFTRGKARTAGVFKTDDYGKKVPSGFLLPTIKLFLTDM